MLCCLKTLASISRTSSRLTRRPSIKLHTIRTCSTIGGFPPPGVAFGGGARGGSAALLGGRAGRRRRHVLLRWRVGRSAFGVLSALFDLALLVLIILDAPLGRALLAV